MSGRLPSYHAVTLVLILLCACADKTIVMPSSTCTFTGITAVDADGDTLSSDPDDWCPYTAPADSVTQDAYSLGPAHPNPTSGRTSIRLSLASAGQARIVLVSPNCEIARTLVDGFLAAGLHQVNWDGLDDAGHPLPSGIYRCQMTASAFTCQGDIEIRR
jgi:hypothetical protein